MGDKPATGPGSGINQRELVRMTSDEIDAFLHEWHTLNFATRNVDDTVHIVALWYGFLDGAVAFHTRPKSQKVQNLRRDPRITCLIEDGGKNYNELRGVEMVGHAELIEDRDQLRDIAMSEIERMKGTDNEAGLHYAVEHLLGKRIGVKLHIDRYVSWDHRKLQA